MSFCLLTRTNPVLLYCCLQNLIGLVIVGLLFAYHYVAAEARQ